MTIGARNLPPTKSKLILEIYRRSNDGSSWLKVNEFDPIPYDANPVYPQYKISGQELCNSNKNLELQIQFVTKDQTILGKCQTTLLQIM
jgi:hypothetical protein